VPIIAAGLSVRHIIDECLLVRESERAVELGVQVEM
jgi:hypothetical protein